MSDTKPFGPNDELAWMVSCPPADECDYRVYFTREDAEVADENFRDECMTDEDDVDRRTQGVVGLVSIDKANDLIARLTRERDAWKAEVSRIAQRLDDYCMGGDRVADSLLDIRADANAAANHANTSNIACPRCMPPGDPCCPYCGGTYGVPAHTDTITKRGQP